MAREPLPIWCFALVIVRQGASFLAVQERKHGQSWYLPGGRVEHTPGPEYSQLRVIFIAEPADDTAPKSTPDQDSLGARWLSLAELAQLPLRSPNLLSLLGAVAKGAQIHPLSLLSGQEIV